MSDHKPLGIKLLTPYFIDKYKGIISPLGDTLESMNKEGFAHPSGHIGVNVGDSDSYEVFKEYFDEILKEIHPNINSSFEPFDETQLEGKTNSYRVRLARNVNGIPLPPSMTTKDRLYLLDRVDSAIASLGEKFFKYSDMQNTSGNCELPDWYFFSRGDEYYDTSGLNNDWPIGRCVYYFPNLKCVIWVGEEDHLRVFCHQQEGDFLNTFENASRLANKLEEALCFSKSADLSYLTTCPTNLGTGMRISIHYKLPDSVSIEKIKELSKPLNLSIRGTDGERTESLGGIVDISNTYRHVGSPKELFYSTWSSICILLDQVESI